MEELGAWLARTGVRFEGTLRRPPCSRARAGEPGP